MAGVAPAEHVGLRRVADAEHAVGRDVLVALGEAAIDRGIGFAEEDRPYPQLGGEAMGIEAGFGVERVGPRRDDVRIADDERTPAAGEAGAQLRLACPAPLIARQADAAFAIVVIRPPI